jgi:uncharacterized membrane protein (UPF0127 family)
MGKRKWPEGTRGFYFPECRSVHTFFTFLKPDILFLDKSQKILKIFPSARPWRIFWGPPTSRHCLELPSGAAHGMGLAEGDCLHCLKRN